MTDGTEYVVRRLNWKEPVDGRFTRLPGWADVAVLPAAEAAAVRARYEDEVRRAVNPFACGGSVFELSTLPPPVLADWLLDSGLGPPGPDRPLAEWGRWWAAAAPGMSAGQSARAWAGLDKLRFAEVAEPPAGADVFVVLLVRWDHDYERGVMEAAFEGGHPVRAFRRDGPAAVAAAEVAAEGRRWLRQDEYYPPALTPAGARAEALRDPFRDPRPGRGDLSVDDAPLADVRRVRVAADPAAIDRARSVFLVHRAAWAWWALPGDDWGWTPTGSDNRTDGLPAAGFLTRTEAVSHAWELDFVARMYLNPFRFGHPRELSSVEEHGFLGVLRDEGLDPPTGEWRRQRSVSGWDGWWDGAVDRMSPAQRAAVWDLLDRLRFHEVFELPLEG